MTADNLPQTLQTHIMMVMTSTFNVAKANIYPFSFYG